MQTFLPEASFALAVSRLDRQRLGKQRVEARPRAIDATYEPPSWVTWDFIRSHRSNLLRKDPVWYGKFGWDVEPGLAYVWPTASPLQSEG